MKLKTILCLSAVLALVSAGTEDLIGSWFDQATDDDDVVDVSKFVASKLGYALVEVERAQIQDLDKDGLNFHVVLVLNRRGLRKPCHMEANVNIDITGKKELYASSSCS